MSGYKNRSRLPNFTSSEEKFLLTLVQQYANIVESKKTDAPTWERKRKVWEKMDVEFAEKFGFRRGSKNLREKYDNLKRKFKKSLVEGDDELQIEHKRVADENMDKLAEILSLTADPRSAEEDSDALNAFEIENDMPVVFDETTQSCSLDDDPIREVESLENEHSDQWCTWNSQQSIQNKKFKLALPLTHSKIKEAPSFSKQNFWELEELRSEERHKWAAERHKRELERHQWEMEKYKLLLEKQKLELEETKLKSQLLARKFKHSPIRARSVSPASIVMFAGDRAEVGTVEDSAAKDMVPAVSTLSPQIKIEPTLDIIDMPIDDHSITNAKEVRKRLASANTDAPGGLHKKSRPTQQDISEEQNQWEKALTNDMLDVYSADSSCHEITHLVNLQFGSDIANNEDDEEDAYNVLNAESKTAAAEDQLEKELTDEREFLNLLTNHKLKHYFVKLKKMNIGLDCFKAIREVDIRDIFEHDIGARIRFRGLVEDWRASNMQINSIFNQQMELDETATKRDIAELKTLVNDAQNSFFKEQVQTRRNQEEIKSLRHCSQNSAVSLSYKEILPEKPYQTVSEFKAFEELIQNSEDAYKNLVDELTAQQFSNTLSFIKSSWRRIMCDNVAKNFCWSGTPEKPAIRTLRVTNALKDAYVRKYSYGSNEEFQRTIISFFQHAKARLQKKQNYEKIKAANLPL